MQLALVLLLPAAFVVAAGAAALARWIDRRTDRVYASHRAMILDLRARLAAWEVEEDRRRAREAWAALGAAAGQVVTIFREAFRPAAEAAESVVRAFAEASRPRVSPPRDPRVSVVPPRRR